jgi:hypothetical protein
MAYVYVWPDHSWPSMHNKELFPNKTGGFGCKSMGYDFTYAIADFNTASTQVNFGAADPGFAGNAKVGQFAISAEGALYKALPTFIPIPFDEIGVTKSRVMKTDGRN